MIDNKMTEKQKKYVIALLIGAKKVDTDHYMAVYEAATPHKFQTWNSNTSYNESYIHLPFNEIYQNRNRTDIMDLLLMHRQHQNHILITATVSELLEARNLNSEWWRHFITLFGTVSVTDESIRGLPIVKSLQE